MHTPPHPTLSSPLDVVFVEPFGGSRDHLRQLLEFEGLRIGTCSGDQLLRAAPNHPVRVLILDDASLGERTVPVVDACTTGARVRLLFLALVPAGADARGIELVERGVDGFLTVPCGGREFVARVRAMLRRLDRVERARSHAERVEENGGDRVVRVRQLVVDPARRRVRAADHELRLTEQEFQLLHVFVSSPGRVFNRQALLDAVWGRDTFVTLRSVDALVKRLRHQLHPALPPDVLETVRGVGYRLNETRLGAITSAEC
ncbi:MAG: response regulator transcription factor [Acidobacteria bacterium]|nr:response regulator transcription factor [Acidobacteriota bacterium]